jgi:hypothetical protein
MIAAVKPCPGCGARQVRSGRLLCKPCWFTVPKELRDRVWFWWDSFQHQGDRNARAKYASAAAAAIASVRSAKPSRAGEPVQLALLPNDAGRVASHWRDDS